MFADRAAAACIGFACPDLNEPDFRTLTVTRMIEHVERTISALPVGPVALVGSSLGAFVALHAAAQRSADQSPDRPIDRLIFLAPALDLVPSLELEFGPDRMRTWEDTDAFSVFHYGDNMARDLGWTFMTDARRYDAYAVTLRTPTLVYQGRRDEVVAPASVERWAATRPWVTLRLVDDGHQLLDHVDQMWADVRRFLEVDG